MPKGVPNAVRMYKTYRARRTQLIGTAHRFPGELVPEAITWFRVESNVGSGYLDEVEVPGAELMAALAKYCPEIAPKYGLKIPEGAPQ